MSNKMIEIEGLSFAYPDGTIALKNISLSISPKERVGIIGPNGAGKSTFLLHLNGAETGSGRVRIGGAGITEKTLPEIRRRVGIVFQDPDNQLFMPTVFDDVSFGPINMGFSGEDVKKFSGDALGKVGMAHASGRISHHLSYGEKKRVSIATVLSMNPDVIAFDEPTSNLDPKARMRLMELIDALDNTIVIASHDLDMIYEICERTVILDKGMIAADGPTGKILTDKALLERHGLLLPFCLQHGPSSFPRFEKSIPDQQETADPF